MAENQMVKIEFDFDLGNVPASAKKFAEYLRGIETSSKEAGDQLKILGQGIDKTADKMSKSGNSIKKSNQQWTSFALVIQDLPYGFRGIQNNLPALIGGIAGAAGPIYLIASALIAFTTAYEKEITAFIYGISAVDSAQQKLNVAISAGIGVAKAETATNAALLAVINDVTNHIITRKDALELLKEKYKGNIELQKTDIEDGKALIAITDKISEALLRKARAEAFSKLIAEEEAKVFKLQAEQGEQVVKNLGFLETSYQVLKSVGNVATTSLNVTTAAFNKQGKEITTAQGNIKLFTEKLNENTLAQIKNKDAESIDTGAPKKINNSKEKAANEARNKSYLDTLDDRGKKEYQAFLDLENNLAKMKEAGYKDDALHLAAYKANMGKIAKEYDDKEYKRNQDSINANIAFETKIYNDSNRAFDAIKKTQADNEESFAKKQTSNIETELNIQERLNKDSLIRRIDFTKQALAKVAVIAAMSFNPNTIGVYLDAIDKLNAKLKGYGEQWNVTAKSINNSIQNFVISSFTLMGESLGKALAGENVDVFNAFAMLLADALTSIGTSLIAYATMVGLAMTLFADPLTWPIALVAGIAAVAAGAFLKSKLSKKKNSGATAFADGGIVSGPTMGLIGEYPGAKSNPEVVAPLDKLKDMLGGNGGGQFVLRGNDLVLALNRSETSLNLRRGS
jgi:hypothetical protein